MKDLIRHGDLLFRPAPQLAKNDRASWKIRKSKVILNGEATGHAHRIVDGEAVILDQYEKTWRSEQPILTHTYVEVTTPMTITHEEHGPLPVMPGLYEVIRAREFDYAANLSRRVVD